MITFVDKETQLRLLESAKISPRGISRINLHSSCDSLMQTMVIAFSANISYPFIRDNVEGRMNFVCLHGSFSLSYTLDLKYSIRTSELVPGEIMSLERKYWRKTVSGLDGCVFIENIEGTYDFLKRESA